MKLSYLFAVIALAASGPIAAQAPVHGMWLMQNGKARVDIYRCGAATCGRVSSILKYPKDGARTDIHNSDPALRSRPLVGLPVLLDFMPDDGQLKGRVYDPKSGRTYRATITPRGGDTLVLKACVLFVCKTQQWSRVR